MDAKTPLNIILQTCEQATPPKDRKPNDDTEYFSWCSKISGEILGMRVNDRRRVAEMMDTVFDGNLYSLEGFSNNKYIEFIQIKANESMKKLHSDGKICLIPTANINTIISAALIESNEEDQDRYYQKVYQNRSGEFVSSKISNLKHNIKLQPKKIFSILRSGHLLASSIVSKELISFIWTFVDIFLFFRNETTIEIEPEDIAVLLNIQKYAAPYISEDALIAYIKANELSFDNDKLRQCNLQDKDISKILDKLNEIEIISIENGTIEIKEEIAIEINLSSNQ